MSNDIRNIVINHPEETVGLDANVLCRSSVRSGDSAIDQYFAYSKALFRKSVKEEIRDDPDLLGLVLVGLTSAVEYYFRTVLAVVIQVCPISRVHAATQQLQYGALDYYETQHVGLALLDGKSLSSSKEVISSTKKLTNIDIKESSSLGVALMEFDKLCQLRHAAAHTRGELGGQNVNLLRIDRNSCTCLQLDQFSFQDGLKVCNNTVRAYNRELFQTLLNRWIYSNKLVGKWAEDKPLFQSLFNALVSREDGAAPRNGYAAYRKIQAAIVESVTLHEGG